MTEDVASDQSLVAEGYDAVYERGPDSPTLARIWKQHATGPGYPAELAHISFLTMDEAQRLAEASGLREGDRLVDLACGAGGPGLLLARETGALLTGIDLSRVGIERARRRADEVGLADRAEFHTGSFDTTGLPDAFADAVMTIDAFQYSLDKRAAMAELARILRPGGRLLLEAFEVDPPAVEGYPVLGVDPVPDYRPLLVDAGFDVEVYEQTDRWRERLTGAYEAVLDEADALTAELGGEGYASLSLEVSLTLGLSPYCGRVLAVATRR